MSDGFVADASVAVAWVHPAQATPQTRLLLQTVYDGVPVEVPAIWPLEISNALQTHRSRLDRLQSAGNHGAPDEVRMT